MERQSKKNKKQPAANNNVMKVKAVEALTDNQRLFFRNFDKYEVLSLSGVAGTGKTYAALYKALHTLEHNDNYRSIKIIRSNVSVRDAGFLPGTIKEKMSAYESPYVDACNELYGRGDAYEILKTKKVIEFHPTSYMRGVTFNNCIVIIDECQNMSQQELDTLITRFGQSCKMILCGDTNQDDLTNERFKERSGYSKILKILKNISSCYTIEFTIDDIVRSGFVREYIIAKTEVTEPLNLTEISERVKLVSTA